MMFFSATFDDKVMKFAETIVPDPIILRLKREEESLDNIKQYFVTCSNEDDKFKALANIYSVISIGQAMVFCRVSVLMMLLLHFLLCDKACLCKCEYSGTFLINNPLRTKLIYELRFLRI